MCIDNLWLKGGKNLKRKTLFRDITYNIIISNCTFSCWPCLNLMQRTTDLSLTGNIMTQTILRSFFLLAFSLIQPVLVFAQPKASLVEVDEVQLTNSAQTTRIVGRIVSTQQGNIAARTSGTIKDVAVRLGDRVSKKQILARLDSALLSTDSALAKAELDFAGASLRTARAQLELARQDTVRLRKLQNSVAASKAQYDDAVQNQRIQTIRVEESVISQRKKEIELEIANLKLNYASITAPYNGVITHRHKQIGDYVQQGEALFSLLNDQLIEVDANIFSSLINTVDENSSVLGKTHNDAIFRAKLRTVITQEDDRTRTLQARFSITESPSDTLMPGQTVTLEIPSGPTTTYLSVHKDAIVYKAGNTVVFKVIDDVAQQATVQLGVSDGNRFEVKDGLENGDMVIVRGNERMRDLQAVKIKKENL